MSGPGYHLCHMNIGTTQAPLSDPVMSGFVNNMERINGLAAASPGFVWHFDIDILSPEYLTMYDEPGIIFNLSVWESVEALSAYVFQSEHVKMMKFRTQWFVPLDGPHYVLWWMPAGHIPTIEEGKQRLDELALHGPTPMAFTFKQSFPSPADQPGTLEFIYTPAEIRFQQGAPETSMEPGLHDVGQEGKV